MPSTDPDARTYHSPLREAQADATRTLLLDTLAEIVATEGVVELSIRDLAKRAGTSERTVYRHFPDRAALFEALTDKIAEERGWGENGRLADVGSIHDLAAAAEASFRDFDDDPIPAQVTIRLTEVLGHSVANTLERNDRVRDLLADLLADLADEELERLLGLIRVLISSRTWLRLRDEFGLDGSESGPTIAWAVGLLLADARRTGRVP